MQVLSLLNPLPQLSSNTEDVLARAHYQVLRTESLIMPMYEMAIRWIRLEPA